MIFSHTWQKVLSGEKTETRRLITHRDRYDPHWIPSTVMTDMCRIKYQVGKRYAVQPGRGKSGIAQIQMLDIYPEDVRCISDKSAWAEGFCSCVDFWRVWCQINDPRMIIWNADAMGIWCANLFKGERVPKEYDTPAQNRKIMHAIGVEGLKQEMMNRPDDRYQAFVYRFELVHP